MREGKSHETGGVTALTISFTLNGGPTSLDIDPAERLLDTLRYRLGLTGTKEGCGACTPGVVMTALWISAHPELLETHTIRELMAGNLCRCTGYDGIVESVAAALLARRGAPA